MNTSQSDGGSRGSSGDIEEIRATKASIRKRIEGMLKLTDKSKIDAGSAAVAKRLLATPQLDEARVVSVYLSMPQEMGTAAIVSDLFKRGNKVYIPKVLGPKSEDMRMFPLASEDEAKSFPLSKWKIPEPSRELVLSREDGVMSGDIDLIVVPGVAFDARCNRLGHGRGYYDCFFERVAKANAEKGRAPPVKVGVCFDEQVIDEVPTSASDVPLDFVLTPSRAYSRSDGGTS